MIEFRDDDTAYLAWIENNPQGFVLNLRLVPDPDYVILHRACCGSISTPKRRRGAFTERSYRKICCDEVDPLRKAAIQEGRLDGTFSGACALCRPMD